MKITKKILSMILAVVMVLSLLPTIAIATDLEALLEGEVYISISDDAEFIVAPDGTPMGFVAVPLEKLLFIDLAEYGLEDYIYDADGDDIPEITSLHLYIYVHEVLLGLDWFDVYITGGPGSIYLAGGLFGFSDENLRYDLNGAYPAVDGWGLTADQIVLSDGDFINVAHYTSWAFWGDSATGFHYFTDPEGNLNHTYTVTAGKSLNLGLVRSFSDWNNGGLPAFEPEIGFEVYYGKTYGEPEGRVYSNEEGMLEITFPTPGTWYAWTNGGYGNENYLDIVSAPAFATVNVPNLIFDLDLTALTEPLYDGGILADDLLIDDNAEAGGNIQYAFTAENYEQYILFLDFYTDSDVVGFRINGTNYYAEDPGDGFVDMVIGPEIYTGYAFGYEDDDGREYAEFYLQLGLDNPYHTAGNWQIVPLQLTEDIFNTIDAIDAIYQNGEQITLACGEAIETATACYNDLSALDKEIFDDMFEDFVMLLRDAQEAYELLANEQDIANVVIAKINAIGTVTLDKDEAINQARIAYDALTETQKTLVTNYNTLTAAEDTLQALKQAAAAKEVADAVEEKIDSIGTVNVFSGKKITTARAAYESLTPEQKNFVENVVVLTEAENTLAELYRQAADADHKAIYEATDEYIAGLGTPSVGSTGGEWMVIDMVRAGNACPEGYYANVVAFVKANINDKEQLHRSKSTENSRVILALTAAGYDVTNVDGHNLLMGLTDMTYIPKQGVNGPIWALIALDSHDYEIPTNPNAAEQATREKLIAYILDKQLSDGGWALSGQAADADITGMAVQALAPYYKTNAQVKTAVDKALVCMSEIQHDNGGYGSIDGVSTESAAQIIVALTALGIDPETDSRFVKNGISVVDALCLFAIDGGGFAHIPGDSVNGMATEQGQYALVAYYRFKNGQTALYDMSDVQIGSTDSNEPPETGDSTPVMLFTILIVFAVAGLMVLTLNKKKIVR